MSTLKKKQIRKGVKVQPLSKYATNEERHDYNARLHNLGRKRVNSSMKGMPYFV